MEFYLVYLSKSQFIFWYCANILGNMKNFSGTLDVANGKGLIRKEGVEEATRHLFAMMYNFDFGLKVWKRSWDMEDNFINVGNSKIETVKDLLSHLKVLTSH